MAPLHTVNNLNKTAILLKIKSEYLTIFIVLRSLRKKLISDIVMTVFSIWTFPNIIPLLVCPVKKSLQALKTFTRFLRIYEMTNGRRWGQGEGFPSKKYILEIPKIKFKFSSSLFHMPFFAQLLEFQESYSAGLIDVKPYKIKRIKCSAISPSPKKFNFFL